MKYPYMLCPTEFIMKEGMDPKKLSVIVDVHDGNVVSFKIMYDGKENKNFHDNQEIGGVESYGIFSHGSSRVFWDEKGSEYPETSCGLCGTDLSG